MMMKSSKLIEILKQGNLVIPLYLLQNYSKWKLELSDFLLLMYLYQQGEDSLFNPQKISNDFHLPIASVMESIGTLEDKGFLEVVVVKNEANQREEHITLEPFYRKVSLLLEEDVNTVDSSNSTIYERIEKEFGRTLSPIEYEIIKAWLDSQIKEEVILEALKEATFNGVSNLRYIDKILYEWGKKGIKTKEDVEQNKQRFSRERKETKEVFDYDWFEDDEEE